MALAEPFYSLFLLLPLSALSPFRLFSLSLISHPSITLSISLSFVTLPFISFIMEINPAVTFKHDCTVMIAKHPKVLIVGAGLGGLTLGMILQKTDIPYEIIERASEVKHLGAGIAINCTVTPAFKQCGIYNELVSISKVLDTINISNEERGIEFVIADNEDPIKRYGSGSRLITRPKLYDFLLRQVPSERIHMSKKALSTLQGGNDVLVRCADGSEYEGDILVRADGAYSAVRQNLYSNSTSQSTPCVRRFTTTLHECLSRRADTPPDSGRVPGSGEDQLSVLQHFVERYAL